MRKTFKRGIRGNTKWGRMGGGIHRTARLKYFKRHKRMTKRAYRGKNRFE